MGGRPELVCHYCGHRVTRERELTRDHVVPAALLRRLTAAQMATFMDDAELHGGPVGLLVRACLPCNGDKADKRAVCACWVCSNLWERYAAVTGVVVPAVWLPPRRRRAEPAKPLTLAQRRRLARRLQREAS